MIRLNLKIALRNLWKNKGFTLINVGGMAIGLASCMILLLYVSYEWSYDKEFSNYDKTYVVFNNFHSNGKIYSWSTTPNTMAEEARVKIPGVAYAAHLTFPNSLLISYKDKKFKNEGIFADPFLLKILNYKFIKGNPGQALKGINTVILTKTLAKKLFGNEDPINKTVKFYNKEPLKVEAVIEDIPANNTIRFDYIIPWALAEKMEPLVKNPNWENNSFLTLLQLRDNHLFDQASAAIKGIYRRHNKNSSGEAMLHPLAKWHLYSEFENGKSVGGKIDQLKIFLFLAFCILLIACVNFMNLSTAKSEKRAKEVGVRKAIGSTRKSLIGQFMVESVLLSFLATIVAFVLVEISLPYFNNLLGTKLTIDYENWKFWFVLFSLISFTGLLAGSYPAFYLSSFDPVSVLKGAGIKAGSSFSVRKILVVFQFVFAACLIICTTIIYQQLNYIKNKPVGYDKGNLLELSVQGNLDDPKKLDLLKEQLLKSGAATSVTFFSTTMNSEGSNTNDVSWPGKDLNEKITFNFRGAGYDFVKTIGTEMVSGREFSAQYPDPNSAVVNEAAVKAMGLKNPLGTTIKLWDHQLTIVGVMKDFVMESAYEKVNPMIFRPTNEFHASVVVLRLNGAQNISSSLAQIDEAVKAINPDFPADRKFVNEAFEEKFTNEQLLGTLSNWFGGFAIFISCLGLLGLALYMAEQRKKEISIRKVLGASTYNILTLLNKDFIKLVLIANLIAFPIAYIIISKWLSSFEFRVTISILPFAIAAILSLIIAIFTVSAQSIKVAGSTPIDALKHE